MCKPEFQNEDPEQMERETNSGVWSLLSTSAPHTLREIE